MSGSRPPHLVHGGLARVGVDLISAVHVVENHDGAYELFRAQRDRTLVHVDAHHDAAPLPEPRLMTIANYVRAAIEDGFVSHVVWIVPDLSWVSAGSRRHIVRHLAHISGDRPRRVEAPDGRTAQLCVSLGRGKTLTACTLEAAPRLPESVLLDIDVDFFVIPAVAYRSPDRPGALPWCWPHELIARLRRLNIRTDLITIAYSVEGGYTPLVWKYLGDELADRLRTGDAEPSSPPWGIMREAALALHAGRRDDAEELYRHACETWRISPAPHYALAQCYFDSERLEEARASFRRALALAPSYRTPYAGAALRLAQERSFAAAEREYRRALALDPDDAFALAGLGWLAARGKRWERAEQCLVRSLALNASQLDAHRLLGDVYSQQRRWADAARAYNQSIKLALSGARSLDAPITAFEGSGPADPGHGRAYARLGHLSARRGDVVNAIANYRFSLGAGTNGGFTRIRLAWLHLRRKDWRSAGTEAGRAIAGAPAEAASIVRQAMNQLGRVFRGETSFARPFSLS